MTRRLKINSGIVIDANLKSELDSIISETGTPILETETVEQIDSNERPIFESYPIKLGPMETTKKVSKNMFLYPEDGLGIIETGTE